MDLLSFILGVGFFPFAEGTHWGMGGAKGKEAHYNQIVPPTK